MNSMKFSKHQKIMLALCIAAAAVLLLLINAACPDCAGAGDGSGKNTGLFSGLLGNGDSNSKVTIEIIGLPEQLSSGEQLQCSAEVLPTDAGTDVVWTSSDESIASAENGLITAYREGEAVITATERVSGKTDEVKITVRNDYLEKTKASIEYLAVSFTDAQAVRKVRNQQAVLSRCTDPAAQEVLKALTDYLEFADGGEQCDLKKVSEVIGVDEKTLRFAAECIYYRGQMSDDSVTMSFAGDCTFGYMDDDDSKDRFPAVYRSSDSVTYPFDRVRHIFEADDITVINYEATLAEKGSKKADKKYHFRGEADYVNILTGSSVEVANQANNHSLDYLEAGRLRTEQLLTDAGIAVLNENTPVIMEVNGIEVVLIAAGHWKYPTKIDAVVKAMHEQIKEYKREDNIVVVNLHWGAEYGTVPDAKQIKETHKMIDEGADLIVCHHAHILQGIEVYKGKVIAYGLGNFAYGGRVTLHEKETFILRATFIKENGKAKMKDWCVVPCYISSTGTLDNNYQPMTLSGKSAKRVISLITKRSKAIKGCTDIPYFYFD